MLSRRKVQTQKPHKITEDKNLPQFMKPIKIIGIKN
jgi:hypothetical protein